MNTQPVTVAAPDPDCIYEGVILPGLCPNTNYNTAYAGPAPFLVAGASQINFQAGDAIVGAYLTVQSPAGGGTSYFQIYVGSQ